MDKHEICRSVSRNKCVVTVETVDEEKHVYHDVCMFANVESNGALVIPGKTLADEVSATYTPHIWLSVTHYEENPIITSLGGNKPGYTPADAKGE